MDESGLWHHLHHMVTAWQEMSTNMEIHLCHLRYRPISILPGSASFSPINLTCVVQHHINEAASHHGVH